MRRLLFGCLMFTGCLKANPAYDNGAEGTSTTVSMPSTSSGGSTGEVPTTGADSSGGAGPGTGSGDLSTGAPDATTGEGSSTGAPARVCLAFETLLVAIAAEDTGVVQELDVDACPWSPEFESCQPLNFGTTEFYRLINDEEDGPNAALIRFPVDSLDEWVIEQGYEADDLLALRIELVMWEEVPAPAEPYTLEIHGLDPANFGWTEGTKSGLVAASGDSNDLCMTRTADSCVPWANGLRAIDGAVSLGLLPVDAERVKDSDQDMIANEYHARLLSEPLVGAIEMFGGPIAPSFAVTMQTQRNLDEQIVGIKLREAPWTDPTLYAELCTKWDS